MCTKAAKEEIGYKNKEKNKDSFMMNVSKPLTYKTRPK
jgi:hypothetical protein